ncbi:hypothetical protein WDW86_21625 [Bdellovibrionota bacterium FG-2]
MIKFLSFTFIVFCFFSFSGVAADIPPGTPVGTPATPAAQWQTLKDLYAAGKLDAAITLLQERPEETSSYYYNLGTLFLRTEKVGKAVAYLEKANHLKPYDPAIQQNLYAARDRLSQTRGADQIDPASNVVERVADRILLDELRGILGMVGLCLVLLWLRGYLKTRSIRRTFLTPSGFVASLGMLITLGLYAAQRITESHPPAVCFEQTAVRSGPADSFLELSKIEAGTKVRSLGPTATTLEDLWRQIKYSDGGIGWVRASNILLL